MRKQLNELAKLEVYKSESETREYHVGIISYEFSVHFRDDPYLFNFGFDFLEIFETMVCPLNNDDSVPTNIL